MKIRFGFLFVSAMTFLMTLTRPAPAGSNAGGTLIVHDAGLAYTSETTDYCGQGVIPDSCGEIDTEIEGSGPDDQQVWKVYAAFAESSSPRLKGITFGIAFSPDSVLVSAYGPCVGDFDNGAAEFPGPGWPGDESGTALVFESTRTSLLVECYWFAGYAYSGGPALFRLVANPDSALGGTFGDDSTPPQLDPIVGFGSLGFGVPGYHPCPSGGQGGGDSPGGEEGPDGGGQEDGGGQDASGIESLTGTTNLTFVEMKTETASAFMDTYHALKDEYGLRVFTALFPDALLCEADEGKRYALSLDGRVNLVTHQLIPNPQSASPGEPGYAERVWNLSITASAPDTIPDGFQGPCVPDSVPSGPRTGELYQTARYMTGDIGVSLLFMESDSSRGCDSCRWVNDWEDWDTDGPDSEVDSAMSRIDLGLMRLANLGSNADATFILKFEMPRTGVEPIHGTYMDPTWVIDAMDDLEVPPDPWYIGRVWMYNNRTRSEFGTDWWYSAFLIRDVCDEDGLFSENSTDTYAIGIWGAYEVLAYHTGGASPGQSCTQLYYVAPHETAHLFGAPDEYVSPYGDQPCHENMTQQQCDSLWGYLKEVNGNCTECGGPGDPCLMKNMPPNFGLCPYTTAHLGLRDADGDGIADAIDHQSASASMYIGEAEALEIGDWVDIFDGESRVKRLPVSRWNSDRGRMVWDGIDADGDPRTPGPSFSWLLNGVDTYDDTLAVESQLPTLSDVVIAEGPCQDPSAPCLDTLTFRFEELDANSGRVRATITPDFGFGIPQRVIADEYLVATGASGPPIRRDFRAARGDWTLNLCVFDARGDSAVREVPFESLSSAGNRRTYVPELQLSRSRPNPSSAWVSWDLDRRTDGKVVMRVIGVNGRSVRAWPEKTLRAGTTRVLWDGLDGQGHPVPSGRYYLVVTDAAGRRSSRSATLVR